MVMQIVVWYDIHDSIITDTVPNESSVEKRLTDMVQELMDNDCEIDDIHAVVVPIEEVLSFESKVVKVSRVKVR